MLPPPMMSGSGAGDPARAGATPPSAFLRQEQGLLGAVFFSARNVDVVQTSLRYRVFRESGGQFVVGRQSDTQLAVLMRGAYEDSVREVPADRVLDAVRGLNESVVRAAAALVLSEVRFHRQYLADVERGNPLPLSHPEMMSGRGTKVLDVFSRLG